MGLGGPWLEQQLWVRSESPSLGQQEIPGSSPLQGCPSPQAAESPGQGHWGGAGLAQGQLLGGPALQHSSNAVCPEAPPLQRCPLC